MQVIAITGDIAAAGDARARRAGDTSRPSSVTEDRLEVSFDCHQRKAELHFDVRGVVDMWLKGHAQNELAGAAVRPDLHLSASRGLLAQSGKPLGGVESVQDRVHQT